MIASGTTIRIRAWAGPVIAIAIGLVLGSCGREQSPPVAPAPPPATADQKPETSAQELLERFEKPIVDPRDAQGDAVLREFLSIARNIVASDDGYLGYEQIQPLIEQRRQHEGMDPRSRFELERGLTREMLRTGEVDTAVAVAGELVDWLRTVPGADRPLGEALRSLGVALLRQAEVVNCIRRRHADGCLLPLAGGGVHAETGPAAAAQQSLREAIRRIGPEPSLVWLYNFSCMAQGEYPDGVEAELLIPPAAFASAGDCARFVDVARQKGIDAFNASGASIVEDFDGDGWLDIVTTTIDPLGPAIYYRNRGDGTFEDRSQASGMASQLGGLNALAADHDGDGDMDVLIMRGGWMGEFGRIRMSLLANDGKGKFTDVTREARIASPAYPSQTAAFGDLDGDGDLDLFVGNESMTEFDPTAPLIQSQLFWNQGDGTYVEGAKAAGVTNYRYAKGCSIGDYDNDGRLDIFISNFGKNRLYHNLGEGKFEDVAPRLGVTSPEIASFPTWFFDYDNDGWLDLYVSGYMGTLNDIAASYMGLEHEAVLPRLYRNTGGEFEDVTAAVGLDRPSLPMGANFGDLDNDGWLDFYLGTGNPDFETLTPNVMYRNDAGRRFLDVSAAGGFGHVQKGHGISFADIDNDGDQDIHHQLGGGYPGDGFTNALFENPGSKHHWLTLALVATRSPPSGFGARIEVIVETPAGRRSIHRAVGTVASFGCNPIRQEIGLGDARRVVELRIRWPRTEAVQVIADVPLDTFQLITEE